MSCSRQRLLAVASALMVVVAVPSCRDRKTTLSTDLQDAGFQMTDADWFRACQEDNVEVMKRFLAGGFSKDARDGNGNTALHVAAVAGAENAAKYLLDKGVPVDVRGQTGRTPLMAAVVADKPKMVKWLLRQGADPKLKDEENFKALMLAVRDGSAGSVAELASYDREDLDAALLLASLLGKTAVIDSLTNYGASVYARMEDDGRTPLMIAAENGHKEAVNLLLEIGASRYTTDEQGRTAANLAEEAGHAEIVALINREPAPAELALEAPEQISAEMDEFVAAAEGDAPPQSGYRAAPGGDAGVEAPGDLTIPAPDKRPSRPIDGAVLGARQGGGGLVVEGNPGDDAPGSADARTKVSRPPVIMRHYRETDVPLEVAGVSGDSATLRVAAGSRREITVKAGQEISGTGGLYVVRVKRRMEESKVTDGHPMEIAVVEVEDRRSGQTREWISGRPSTAHDPIALVEDPATGARYTARPGQKFKSADGGEFVVTDVRPNQIVIESLTDGSVVTVPLVGPRG
ncbi:ankyrin repeat domain-containing protein [Luteolibacter sp. SL250]|uniref:ankyrin repeat domain-containing protein n=1 Tax=Luteolibacter sp. SL250 TaxID=2995170 RepID=UPI0022700124|nr:ankyrin repeat domain-containing protein [Luteolibacter sp. SL250]WAC20850.1 ankyrin repeat domain-containing protein [Luteolibacter sp. SL250]